MTNIIKDTFSKIGKSKSTQQKYIHKLLQHYKVQNSEEFNKDFFHCLQVIFGAEITTKSSIITNSLIFAVDFCINVANTAANDEATHPFLIKVICEVLKYTECEKNEYRYYSCTFFELLFKKLGDVFIDVVICDEIEKALLLCLKDKVYQVRVQAAAGLEKLQNPQDINCRVIAAYIDHLGDSNPMVRKKIINIIGPCKKALPFICMKVRDVDKFVRITAYEKCATINPKYIKIADRHTILLHGFMEEDSLVKNKFINVLITKWVTLYDDDFLKFFNALKLDASDDDFKATEYIFSNLMDVIFKIYPISAIVNILPIEENNIIPHNKISFETVVYWKLIIRYLQNMEKEDRVQDILPDLCMICACIERFSKTEDHDLSSPQNIEKQHILKQLLEIVVLLDLTEEAGRQRLRSLILNILFQQKLVQNITLELIAVLEKVQNSVEALCTDLFEVIAKLQQPVNVMSPQNHQYLLAKMNCHLNDLECQQEAAIKEKEFSVAAKLNEAIDKLKGELAEMSDNLAPIPKGSKINSMEQCVLILISLLKLPKLKELPEKLMAFKDEYVTPLISTNNKLYSLALEFIILCGLIDRNIAEKYLQDITIPIVTYALISNYDEDILLLSIKGCADLILMYGTDIYNNKSTTQLNKRNSIDEALAFNNVTADIVVETITDILDDENVNISYCAGTAVLRFILNNVIISPNLTARIILKWFNPMIENQNEKLHQQIGVAIAEFALLKNSQTTLEKCIIPLLTTIANAPKTSPLKSINISIALNFLSTITKISRTNHYNCRHKNIAKDILHELHLKPDRVEGYLFIKMLLHLDVPNDDDAAINELTQYTKQIIESIEDKNIDALLKKYLKKLSIGTANIESIQTDQTVNETNTINHTNNNNESANLSTINNNSTSTNRRQSNQNNVTNKTTPTCNKSTRSSINRSTESQQIDVNLSHKSSNSTKGNYRTKRKKNKKQVEKKKSPPSSIISESSRSTRSSKKSNSTDIVESSTDSDCSSQPLRRSKRRKI